MKTFLYICWGLLLISGANAANFPAETNAFISSGASWRYHNLGIDLGNSWRESGFDDSLWSVGVSQLGNGDQDEDTPIDIGPSGARYMTIYFRYSFTVSDALSYTNMVLRLLRDDGGVVYLNGVEVFRSNMPTNQINYSTRASSSVPSSDETTTFYTRAFVPTMLKNGQNVVAVEIHQNAPDSSDLSFDFELRGIAVPSQGPAYVVRHPANYVASVGTNAIFSVVAAGAPPISYQWRRNGTNIPGATGPILLVPNVQLTDAGIYSAYVSNALGWANSGNAALIVKPPTTHDLTRDFSPEMNPAGAWSYGYQPDFAGAFYTFPDIREEVFTGGAAITHWENLPALPPRLSFNGSGVTGTSDNGQGIYPPGTLWLTPGVEGQRKDNYGVVRFTVPANGGGIYEFFCAVDSQLNGPSSGDSDFHLLKNGTEFFYKYLGPNASASYSNNLFLIPGETIDFVFGRGADNVSVGSGLKLKSTFNLVSSAQVAPNILVQPQSQIGSVGSNIVFTVIAHSSTPMAYQWQFNGKAIPGATAASLNLSNLEFSQAGTYSVMISNAVGVINSSSATLRVKPAGTYDLARDYSRTANPGGAWAYGRASDLGTAPILFDYPHTSVNGAGLLIHTWASAASDSPSINCNRSLSAAPSGSLPTGLPPGTVWITPDQGQGAGYSMVQFTVPVGASGAYELVNFVEPYLWGANSVSYDYHILKNGLEIFRNSVRGAGGGGYTNILWLESGETLQFAVGPGTGVDAGDSGLIIEAILTPVSVVPTPVTILVAPQDQVTAVGGNMTMTVAANGTGPLRYQWSFEGQNIEDATNSVLSLIGVTTGDVGTYKITVTDARGESVSALAKLTLLTFENGFVDTFDPDWNPLLWSSFGGTVLANTNGGSLSGSNALWFGGSGSRYAITRSLNTMARGSLSFAICLGNRNFSWWDQPELPADGVVVEYSSNNGATWYFLSKYDSTNFLSWNVQTVDLPSSAWGTNMLFRWRQLSNGGESQDHWAIDDVQFLLGNSPPIIARQPVSQIVTRGNNIVFSVGVIGSQPRSYQWRRNGVNLPGQQNPMLSLLSVTTNETGWYSVVISNAFGTATSSEARLEVYDWGDTFQIISLRTNNSYTIDHNTLTSDDRGGIAVSSAQVFVTGDANTARFALRDLSSGTSLGRVYDGLVCDLQSEMVYSLGNGNDLIGNGGGTVTTLLEMDPSNGVLSGNVINLSMPIPFSGSSSTIGIFSGFGRVLLHNGTRVFMILMPSGAVFDLGAMAVPTHRSTESWAYWGVAEYYGGSFYLVYVNGNRINRARVPDGQVTTIATFNNLSDMASITVSPYLDRWYFHHENSSQFGSGSELVGYADASFSFPQGNQPPSISYQPQNQAVLVGGTLNLSVSVRGTRPYTYEWLYNGQVLATQTGAVLRIDNVTTNNAGTYSLRVRNSYGTVTSSNIPVWVVDQGPEFQIASLLTNNAYTVDRSNLTGDDRGGIAISGGQVFVTGDSSTARFALSDLSGGTMLGRVYDGLVSDLRTEKAYCMGNGTNLISGSGGTVTTLWELDSATGLLTGNAITLSSAISLGYGTCGVFSGWGRIIILAGSSAYQILMPYGLVVPLGSFNQPTHSYSESWAYWGVAEYFSNSLSVVYVRDSQTICRTRLSGGETNTLATFENLSDMSSFTVAPYWNRWYFQHEYSSQFGSGSELVGFAEAQFIFTPEAVPPSIGSQPKSQPVLVGENVTLNVMASGARPFSYQWYFDGQELSGETNSTLLLTAVGTNNNGAYSVRVMNAHGFIDSSNAVVTVLDWGEEFQIVTLSSNNSLAVESYPITGSQAGGIAASPAKLFINGNSAAGSFNLTDLLDGSELARQYPALINNLADERVYSFANGTNLLSTYYGTSITTLLEHDPVSGELTGRRIELTAPIPFTDYRYGDIGFFAGYNRIVVHTGIRVYMILMPSGLVVDLGDMDPLEHGYSSYWAYWGVAEYFENTLYLTCVQNRTTISRTRVPDGQRSTVATFADLSYYMGSFTVAAYLDRWYFQHAQDSQFRTNGNQTVGFADAAFRFTSPARPPEIVSQPIDQSLSAGSSYAFSVSASGTRPLSYQWSHNGLELAGATNAMLTLANIGNAHAGVYSVIVSNVHGVAVSSNAALVVHQLSGGNFQISSLTTNNAYAVEHSQLSGDSRGAIAASGSHVFYSGDNGTVPFTLGDLAPGTNNNRLYDAMVSNLRTETVYSLGNGTNTLANGGGTITCLIAHDPVTGLLTTNRIELSTPITVTGSSGTVGIFSGYDRVVLHTGSRVYDISLPSGTVTDLGRMGTFTRIPSEIWGYWGVAEFVDGVVSLVYVRDSQTIVRTRVPDGLTSTVASFTNLGTMASITVSLYLNRWYFHHEYDSQFRPGDETLGFAEAEFQYDEYGRPPEIVGQPSSQSASTGSTINLRSTVKGSLPLYYQWIFNGTPIQGANSPGLLVTPVNTAHAGRYTLIVSNAYGMAISDEALLNVFILPGEAFHILELSTNGAYAMEHADLTGDDRSAIAVSSDRVFYTGDSGTAGFSLTDLGDGTYIGRTNDALVSDLKTGIMYSLGNGATPLGNGGGTVTTLLEHDSTTGTLNGMYIGLSAPIPLSGPTYSGFIGIFSGYGRVVLHTGARVYDIALPSGYVTDLGAMTPPMRMASGSWAYWGVAELIDGVVHLVNVADYYTISRTRVPDGLTTPVARFSSLGNMSAITVVPALGRWYFHHTYSSQFRSGDETIGFADARLSVELPPNPPAIAIQPRSSIVIEEGNAQMQVWATGGRPLNYQWQFNGIDLPQGTNSLLLLTNISLAQAGAYTVVVSNTYGSVVSEPAILQVWDSLPIERTFRIANLSTNNAATVEHYNVTGSSRGGLAISQSRVFYTGYNATGRFRASDLGEGTNTPARYEAMASNLRTETAYVLANRNTPIPSGGGNVTALLELDSATGELTGNRIDLSSPITLGYGSGIFSGYDQIVLHGYNNYHVYVIDLPSGYVVDLGYMYFYNYNYTGWAYWGIAEQFNGQIHLVYVPDSTSIRRIRVPDGTNEVVATFSNLGGMYGISLSLSRGRWYFEFAGSSQFGTGSATLGYADATWDYPPVISKLRSQTILEDTASEDIPFNIASLTEPAGPYAVSARSSRPGLIADTNIFLQGSGSNWTIRVVPAPNASVIYYEEPPLITVFATNSLGLWGSRTFEVNILPINDAPSFDLAGEAISVLQTAIWQTVFNWVTNVNVGPLNEGYEQGLLFVMTNDNPTLFLEPPYIQWDGSLRFTPNPGGSGTAVVTTYLRDTGGTNYGGIDTSIPKQFTITVLPVNHPPSFALSALEHVSNEDAGPQIVTAWATNILAGPEDEAGQSLAFSLNCDNTALFAVQPAISSAGSLTYLAAANAHGTATITVSLHDNGGTENGGIDISASQQFVIRVEPVNDVPIAYPQHITVEEDSWVSIILGASESDSGRIGFELLTSPTHGTLTGVPPNLAYRPTTNYSGADSFTFRVTDGEVWSEPAAVTITVTPVADPPVAVARAWSPSLLRSNEHGITVLAPDNSNAVVVLDASRTINSDEVPFSCYWWVDGETNAFGLGETVTNQFGLGEWAIVLGCFDGTSISTNLIMIRVITPATAVEELLITVNQAPIERKEKKHLLDKLKESVGQFEKRHAHSGLVLLRQFQARLVERVAPLNGELVEQLHSASQAIIYALEGLELQAGRQILENLLLQVNNATLVRKDKKPLVDKLRETLSAFDKGHWEPALNQLRVFQEKVQDHLVPNEPVLAGALTNDSQEVVAILEDLIKRSDGGVVQP